MVASQALEKKGEGGVQPKVHCLKTPPTCPVPAAHCEAVVGGFLRPLWTEILELEDPSSQQEAWLPRKAFLLAGLRQADQIHSPRSFWKLLPQQDLGMRLPESSICPMWCLGVRLAATPLVQPIQSN